MKTTSRHSVAGSVAMCLCLVVCGGAHAASTTLPVGGDIMYFESSTRMGGAPVQFSGGTSTLTFSKGPIYDPNDGDTLDGFASFLAVTDVAVRVSDPNTSVKPLTLTYWNGDTKQLPGAITSQIESLSVDPSNGKVSGVNLSGAFSLEAPFYKGVARGGVATVSKLRIDLDNKRVIANLDGVVAATGALPSKSFNLQDATLFTFGALSGPTVYPFEVWVNRDECKTFPYSNCFDNRLQLEKAGYTVDSQTFEGRALNARILDGTQGWGPTTGYYVNGELKLSGLALAPEAQGFLADSLGLVTQGLITMKNASNDVGSVTLQTRYVFGVPEPETYALMGLGLCFMAGVVRRHKRLVD